MTEVKTQHTKKRIWAKRDYNKSGAPTPNFYGRGSTLFYIYPDSNWKKRWGPKPLLGMVWSDDPFYAEREAYTKNLLPVNVSFGVIALTEELK